MTARLFVMYPPPKNTQEFELAYRDEHLPMAGPKLKGATGVSTLRVVGPASAPPPYYLISEVVFPDVETLKSCTTSEDGRQAVEHAASISTGGAPMVIAVVDHN